MFYPLKCYQEIMNIVNASILTFQAWNQGYSQRFVLSFLQTLEIKGQLFPEKLSGPSLSDLNWQEELWSGNAPWTGKSPLVWLEEAGRCTTYHLMMSRALGLYSCMECFPLEPSCWSRSFQSNGSAVFHVPFSTVSLTFSTGIPNTVQILLREW